MGKVAKKIVSVFQKTWDPGVVTVFLGLFFACEFCNAQDIAELDESCIITILNRNAQIQSDGTFGLGNIPVPQGAFRARIVCEEENGVRKAQSAFVEGVQNGETDLGEIFITEAEDEIPVFLAITSPATTLTPQANGAQLVTTGTLPDGLEIDLTLANSGTYYISSNPSIATASADGFVLAQSSGNV
jgi:hypothetical protein